MGDIERALAGTYAGVCAEGPDGLTGMGRLITPFYRRLGYEDSGSLFMGKAVRRS